MRSLRVRPGPGGRVRPGLLAGVVVAVVLGILGMHGIGAHGADLHGSLTRADAAASSALVVADHRSGVVHPADAHPAAHAGGAADGEEGVGGMVMMCVAMLAGAAVALLALVVRRGRLTRWWAIVRPDGRLRVPVPAVLRVGTGPPAVWRFSVIRC